MTQFPQQLPRAAVVAAWALLLLMGAALLALSGFLVVQQLRGGALTPAQTKDLWPFLGTVLGVVATLIGVLVADQQKRRTDAVTRESANRQELETIAKVLELIDVQDPHTRRARVSGAVATMMELQGGTVGIRLLRELWQADAIDPDTAVWFIDREFRACLDPRERNRQGKSPADAEADAVAAADALAVNAHKLVPTSGDCDQLNACWPEQLAQWRPELPLAARRHVVFACLRMILARSPRWWRGVGQAKPLTTLLGALDDPDLGPRVADALCALLDLGVAAAIMPDLPAATVAGIRARAAGRPLSAPMRYLIDQFAVWVDGRPPDIFGRRLREDHWSEAILGAGDSGGRRSSTKGESEDAVLLPGVVEPGEPLRRGGRVPAGAPDREAGPGAPHGPRGLDRGRP